MSRSTEHLTHIIAAAETALEIPILCGIVRRMSGLPTIDMVVPEEIHRILEVKDVQRVDVVMGAGLGSLATGSFSRDEVTVAYLALAESASYVRQLDNTPIRDLDGLIRPVLQQVTPLYPDSKPVDTPGEDALKVASRWLKASFTFDLLFGAVRNTFAGRMKCVETRSGRLVFCPKSSLETELRNRWFEQRWLDSRCEAGLGVVRDGETAGFVSRQLDSSVQTTDLSRHIYRPPMDGWYTDYCGGIASRVIEGQFAHVADFEIWGGLTKQQTIAALRPLYRWAARRYFGHLRAFKYLKERRHQREPFLVSTIDIFELDVLIGAVVKAAGVSWQTAGEFARSLVWKPEPGDKFDVHAYPLIPLQGHRVAMIPSALLWGNWALAREQATARGKTEPSSIGKVRDKRHSRRLVDLFKASGIKRVAAEVVIKDVKGTHLTDLDIVVVDDNLAEVFVLQVKSFVTPGSLVKLDKADKDVTDALSQCDTADKHRTEVQSAIELRFSIRLAQGWVLRQAVVVEHMTGAVPPSAQYPAVSLEWIENEGRRYIASGMQKALWRAARDLPDAATFLSAFEPRFVLVDDAISDLKTGFRLAVFVYG